MSDSMPIAGFRRRSYLVVAGLVGAAGWLALADAVTTPSAALLAIVATSFSSALSDVVVDSIVVEHVRHEHLQDVAKEVSARPTILPTNLPRHMLPVCYADSAAII